MPNDLPGEIMKLGSCHCGVVKFSVTGEIEQVIECNCSHCSRKGLLLWFVPPTALTIISGADHLTTYSFNQHVIQYRFCSICGCQPFGLGRLRSGKEAASINIRCLEDVDLENVKRVPVNGREF
jgi:hypothetical protein